MTNDWVSKIINDQIKEFNSLCDEVISPYDEKSSSACIHRINLKSVLPEKYVNIVKMLQIVYALDGCDSYEFEKLFDEVDSKYEVTRRS